MSGPPLLPPENFRCASAPNRSITCTWDPPQQGKVHLAYSYRLYMKKTSEAAFSKIKEFKDVFEHTQRGLEPNTEYDFKLMSFTPNRPDGPCTAVVTVRTHIAGPSVAPVNLRESLSSLDTLAVEWELPPCSDPVSGFRLFMDEEGSEEYFEENLPAAARSFKACYLRMDTVYRFQVLAFNDAGEGPMSDIVRARTQQDAVSRFLQKRRKPDQIVSKLKKVDIRGERAPPPAPPAPEPEPEPAPVSKPNMPFVPSCERRSRPSAPVVAPEPEPVPAVPEDPEAAERRRRREKKNQYVNDIVNQSALGLVGKKLFTAEPPTQAAQASVVSRGAEPPPTSAALALSERMRERRELEAQLAARGDDVSLPFMGEDRMLLVAGTIRGKKNAVRSALSTLQETQKQFESELLERVYNEEKDGKIVLYVTSVQAVRKTYDDCRSVLKIFEILKKKVQVKDVALDPRFIAELEERIQTSVVPQLFVNAIYIGGLHVIHELNDGGDLAQMLEPFENRAERPCGTCGGIGYFNCTWCQGSKKSLAHRFEKDPRKNALKCTVCNENGLQRCPDC